MRRSPAVLLLCVVLGVSACERGSSDDRDASQARSDAPGWTTEAVRGAGLSVSYPAGWTPAGDPLQPFVSDPRELVALSTFPARGGGENCAHLPENAIEDMGPADALLLVEERLAGDGLTPADFPPRPERFGPSDGYPSEAVDCLDRRKIFFDRLIAFGESGRRFYVYVAFGADTPQTVRTQAWAILDRLETEPAG